jgi:hypothetical protein
MKIFRTRWKFGISLYVYEYLVIDGRYPYRVRLAST